MVSPTRCASHCAKLTRYRRNVSSPNWPASCSAHAVTASCQDRVASPVERLALDFLDPLVAQAPRLADVLGVQAFTVFAAVESRPEATKSRRADTCLSLAHRSVSAFRVRCAHVSRRNRGSRVRHFNDIEWRRWQGSNYKTVALPAELNRLMRFSGLAASGRVRKGAFRRGRRRPSPSRGRGRAAPRPCRAMEAL